jgi:hypothetical protein
LPVVEEADTALAVTPVFGTLIVSSSVPTSDEIALSCTPLTGGADQTIAVVFPAETDSPLAASASLGTLVITMGIVIEAEWAVGVGFPDLPRRTNRHWWGNQTVISEQSTFRRGRRRSG